MANFDFANAQRKRFIAEKGKIAERLRALADEVDRIAVYAPDGGMREPSEIVGQVTHTVLWGVANARLDMMASWATGVYELERYDRRDPECGYEIADMRCVLDVGHSAPISDDGLLIHVAADGTRFQ